MPVISKRDDIFDYIDTLFTGITTANGYYNDIGYVNSQGDQGKIPAEGQYPALIIRGGEEEFSHLPGSRIESILGLVVHGWIKGEIKPRTEINKLIADVHKAFYQDKTFGGRAVWTKIDAIPQMGYLWPYAYFIMEVSVLYRFNAGEF